MHVKKRSTPIYSFISNLLRKKFVRFAAIGGIGIVINDGALFVFFHLLNIFYPIAYVLAFAVSNGINFFMNQLITYPEHRPNRALIWIQRLLKAELTSVSGLVISLSVALICHYIFHISEYIANPIGLCFSFVYKYLVSDRFVYRSKPKPVEELETDPMTPPTTDDENVTSMTD